VADIDVTLTAEDEDSFTFAVVVSEAESTSRHEVTLSRADYQAQGHQWWRPEDFVARCFVFLLEREPKESILARFDIRDIGRYFPDFERDVLHPEG
jgi:hypothetical protein